MPQLMSSSSSSLSSASASSSSLSPSTYASRFVMSMSVIFVTSIILSFVSVEVTLGAELQKEHRKLSASSPTTSSSSSSPSSSPTRAKRIVRSVDSQSPTQGLVDIIDQVENASGNENLLLYTPTTPSPEDVNCYVEVPVTRHVGGRCVNLGSFIGCQAGIYLAFDSTCDQRLGALAEGQSADELRARRRNHPFMRNRHSNPFRSRPRS